MLSFAPINFSSRQLLSKTTIKQKDPSIKYIIHENEGKTYYVEKQRLIDGKWVSEYRKNDVAKSDVPKAAWNFNRPREKQKKKNSRKGPF